MSDVVNLNRARKTRSRADAADQAAANRARFGLSKAERAAAAARSAKADKALDAHRREP